jgi:hypothetical protein
MYLECACGVRDRRGEGGGGVDRFGYDMQLL